MNESELRCLLADLSLEEKIGQMIQLPGYFQNAGNITGPANDMGFTQDDLRFAGSYLSIIGAEKLRQMQTEFMAQHPHHIPLLFMADIINGYRTVFPIPLAQACTFDPDLIEKSAAVAAREAAVSGLHVTFSPMADLVREVKGLGYGVYLCSNATSCVHQYFDRIPGSECFDGMIVSADYVMLKPQHEIYELLFETYSLTPSECFFIDDNPSNVEGALLLGMPGTVFFNDMARLRRELRQAGVPVRES